MTNEELQMENGKSVCSFSARDYARLLQRQASAATG
jgi:hypothetical protein